MLNLNYNIIRAKPLDIGIAPILSNMFDYLIVGAGGGGAGGGGSIGGNGGAGGQVISGSFDFNHLTTSTINVGTGGAGGGGIGVNGTAGNNSSIVYQLSTFTATGGAPGTNSSESNRDGITSTIDSGDYTWAQNGTKGGDSPTGGSGFGGGTGNQPFPWGTSPFLVAINGFTNSGGGGGGARWGEFPGGQGADGMCMLRFADPRNVFDYTGDWDVFVYQNGYKYFYWQNSGTFTLLGKKD